VSAHRRRTDRLLLLAGGLLLTIQGASDSRWGLSCDIGGVDVAGRRIELRGAGPAAHRFAAGPVDCRIDLEAGERLRVELADDRGNVSRAEVGGAAASVRLRGG
jgi:hypothetical protein